MRGPSSSHCAASLRIGRICRDLMGADIRDVVIRYDPNGSLATTHKSQGSDMGLFGGFLGWDADDERLPAYLEGIEEAGIHIQILIEDIGANHPNTYSIQLFNNEGMHELVALSTGGGMIEIIEIDKAPLQMYGDYHETLIYSNREKELLEFLDASISHEGWRHCKGTHSFIQLKTRSELDPRIEAELAEMGHVQMLIKIQPVLPVMARKELQIPFITCEEMLEYNRDKKLELWELALHYESARGGMSLEQTYAMMKDIVSIMENAVHTGLRGTEYSDRILGCQSGGFRDQWERGALVNGDVLNRVILYTTAIMEVKSSMGVIVAAPTAGSCGALPGAVLGVADGMGLSQDAKIKAMLAAGLIGLFIAAHASFAAEVGGCQAETGSGGGMAAAGIAFMMGAKLEQCLAASSLALQNALGIICDPVANRVEAPCLGRNVMAASNAITCANMALAGYDHLIPLDQVVETMDKVGKAIAHELRCTALGGLSVTPASREIEERLNAGEAQLHTTHQKFKIC